MPIARFQTDDGRVARFEVPDGTTPEQAQSMFSQWAAGQSAQQQAAQPPAPNQAGQDLSWQDVAKQAFSNIPSSAAKFAGDIAQPFLHPVDTVRAVKGAVQGAGGLAADKIAGLLGAQPVAPSPEMQAAQGVGQFYADRYGGVDELKRTLASDPVGAASDLATILSGGGALAAKLPGAVGKVGALAGSVGQAIDPAYQALRGAGKVASYTGPFVAELIGGLGTHTGAESLKGAARAGLEGGDKGATFKANLRQNVPLDDVVSEAKAALGNMRSERGAQYRAGMAGVKADQTVLDLAPVEEAIKKVEGVKKFKDIDLSESTAGVRGKINAIIEEWRSKDPVEYHTPEGFDALKQKIGDVRDSTDFGTPARSIADQAYNAVKAEIVKQAPDYAKVMKGYEEASGKLREIEKGLSLGEKASSDTALRKLQSVMRNNANTNYGNRVRMADELAKSGSPDLMEALAGQSLSSWVPRGIGGKITPTMTAGLGYLNPAILAALPFQSPRLMGESAYALGAVGRGVEKTQLPRLARELASRLGPEGARAALAGSYQTGRQDPAKLAKMLLEAR